MIEFSNINFRYAGGTEAGGLVNINLIIPDGQVILLCGQSGCGKTTLTRLVNGLIPNYYEGKLSGEVLLDGKTSVPFRSMKRQNMWGAFFKIPVHSFLRWTPPANWPLGVKIRVCLKKKSFSG